MRKIWRLLSLTTLILLLKSCSIGNSNMRKMFFARNNNQIANEQLEALLEAIQSKNAQAVKELFSDNAWAESGNMEKSILVLFDYFQGELVSYKSWAGPSVHATKNHGEYWKSYDCTYDFETSKDKYRLAMEIVTVDTTDADNIGIRSLYIIRFEDDTDQNCAYRGDGEHTPGINIGKTE